MHERPRAYGHSLLSRRGWARIFTHSHLQEAILNGVSNGQRPGAFSEPCQVSTEVFSTCSTSISATASSVGMCVCERVCVVYWTSTPCVYVYMCVCVTHSYTHTHTLVTHIHTHTHRCRSAESNAGCALPQPFSVDLLAVAVISGAVPLL